MTFKTGDYVVGCEEWGDSDPYFWPAKAHPTRVCDVDAETGRVLLSSGRLVDPDKLMLFAAFKATKALAEGAGPPSSDYSHSVDALGYAIQNTREKIMYNILSGRKSK